MTDQRFKHLSGQYHNAINPRTLTTMQRSDLLRWVWVVTVREVESNFRSFYGAMVCDDFGNLQHVAYIHPTVVGSKEVI